jgi:hypothetical protein
MLLILLTTILFENLVPLEDYSMIIAPRSFRNILWDILKLLPNHLPDFLLGNSDSAVCCLALIGSILHLNPPRIIFIVRGKKNPQIPFYRKMGVLFKRS